jgi:hypothetical protein
LLHCRFFSVTARVNDAVVTPSGRSLERRPVRLFYLLMVRLVMFADLIGTWVMRICVTGVVRLCGTHMWADGRQHVTAAVAE